MSQRVAGKVAVVTGAASPQGLGFASAALLAREGAQLVLTDINEQAVKAAAAKIVQQGGTAVGVHHDVTSEAGWREVVQSTLDAYGRLDILVNNAGIVMPGTMDVVNLSDFERQIAVNLTGVFLGSKLAMEQMRKQRSGGSIVNMSSLAGLIGAQGMAAYSASKGGVRLMSKTIALEGAREGIRCNTIHPGVIATDMHLLARRENPQVTDAVRASIPMGSVGEPIDVAYCVLFLASDEAKYVTGSELVVDGGLMAQ